MPPKKKTIHVKNINNSVAPSVENSSLLGVGQKRHRSGHVVDQLGTGIDQYEEVVVGKDDEAAATVGAVGVSGSRSHSNSQRNRCNRNSSSSKSSNGSDHGDDLLLQCEELLQACQLTSLDMLDSTSSDQKSVTAHHPCVASLGDSTLAPTHSTFTTIVTDGTNGEEDADDESDPYFNNHSGAAMTSLRSSEYPLLSLYNLLPIASSSFGQWEEEEEESATHFSQNGGGGGAMGTAEPRLSVPLVSHRRDFAHCNMTSYQQRLNQGRPLWPDQIQHRLDDAPSSATTTTLLVGGDNSGGTLVAAANEADESGEAVALPMLCYLLTQTAALASRETVAETMLELKSAEQRLREHQRGQKKDRRSMEVKNQIHPNLAVKQDDGSALAKRRRFFSAKW